MVITPLMDPQYQTDPALAFLKVLAQTAVCLLLVQVVTIAQTMVRIIANQLPYPLVRIVPSLIASLKAPVAVPALPTPVPLAQVEVLQ